MRKNFKDVGFYPQPVLIIGTYDTDGVPDAMNVGWGGLVGGGYVEINISQGHKTTENLSLKGAFTVSFAGPYYYASIVCVAKDGSPQASAKGISELTGTATAQIETIWYDTCLPQIKGAEIQTAAETAPAMLMALETGAVEFICTDIPTAKGAVAAYDDMVILDFTDTEDNFQVDEGDINIGISLKKGNTELKDAINKVVSALNKDNFDNLMDYAVSIQPLNQ